MNKGINECMYQAYYWCTTCVGFPLLQWSNYTLLRMNVSH